MKKPGRILLAVACLLSIPTGAMADAAPSITDKIDWPQFMARHDLLWDQLPTSKTNSPHFGNAEVGSMIMAANGNANTILLPIFRNDVQDHRDNSWGWTAYSRPRFTIGQFKLHTVGKVTGCNLRLDLWNAELTGTFSTDKGQIKIRHFVHANDMAIVTELTPTDGEKDCKWEWVADPAVPGRTDYPKKPEDRAAFAAKYGDQYADMKVYVPNPPGHLDVKDGISVWTQDLTAGGQYAIGWTEKTGNEGRRTMIATITNSYPAATAAAEAAANITAFAKKEMSAWTDEHRKWWHDYYQQSFISIPDTRIESAYWGTIYRLACSSRTGRGYIDTPGIWFFSTGWCYTTMDFNIQTDYWGVYAANRLNVGGGLIDLLQNHQQALIDNVRPVEWQKDSAYLDLASSQDLIAPRFQDKRYSTLIGLLPWILNDAWMQYRYSMDDELLRKTIYPLLERAMNFYFHLAQDGPDGKLHLPPTYSPESGDHPDCNFDLGLMRWGCQTLLWSADRLKINDPLIPKWKDALARLPDFPHDDSGIMFGLDKPYDGSHRHGSHLLGVYPLQVLTIDQPANRELVKLSATSFASSRSDLMDMVGVQAAPIAAVAGLPEMAYHRILWNDDDLEPSGLNNSGCIECSVGIANSIQQLLIQSWGDKIRVFPAMPKEWPDAVFSDLRTEGAFLVSARYAGGKTQWVRIKSLAGEPCRVVPNLDGAMRVLSGDAGVGIKSVGDGVYEVNLAKGQEVTLVGATTPDDLSIAPLPAKSARVNTFGVSAASDGYRKERLKDGFAQLSDPDPLMVWSGVRIIGDKGTADDILPLLKAATSITDKSALFAVANVMPHLLSGPNRIAGLASLRQAVDDPALVLLAMPILCLSGTTDDVKLIAAKAATDDPALRKKTLESLVNRRKPDVGPVLLDLYKSAPDESRKNEIAQAYISASHNQQKPELRRKMLEDAATILVDPKIQEKLQKELSSGG